MMVNNIAAVPIPPRCRALVFMSSSVESVIAFFALLETRGASEVYSFVPVDRVASAPSERSL